MVSKPEGNTWGVPLILSLGVYYVPSAASPDDLQMKDYKTCQDVEVGRLG